MNIWARCATCLLMLIASAAKLYAGGSGLNVVVVLNQNSPNSVELGNYYCEQRQVPPQNVLRINWTGGNIGWTKAELETILRGPLNAMLAARQLTNQIDFVLLSMDIPYRVTETGLPLDSGVNSTTSCLYYGFKPDGCLVCPFGVPGCNLAPGSASAYAGSEGVFRLTPPISASSNSWLAMMLTSSNLAQAKAVVDRGVGSDGTLPTETVYLIHFDFDPFRGVRYVNYDDSIFDNRVRGVARLMRTNTYSPSAVGFQLGSQFGLSAFALPENLFAAGAMGDNLTSFGGYLFEGDPLTRQTTALDYLNAGATASFGTVVEPCNWLEKFPSPRDYFYQARGFSVAECYYLSVTNPYQGILVGEPLAAPFAVPCTGAWSHLPPDAVLTGTTNLSLGLVAADAERPIQQVDLFLDGTFLQTITNVPPRANNILYVTLNGFPTNYTVPANASLKSVASNLVARLNRNTYSNATQVAAFAHGDRVELRSLALNTTADQVSLSVSNYIGTATALTTHLAASRASFLETVAFGFRNFVVTNAVQDTSFLQLTVTKTNGSVETVNVTNTPGNPDASVLVQALVNAVNTNANLMTADGVTATDFIGYDWLGQPGGEFNLSSRGSGWSEAQIQAQLTGSSNFHITPTGTVRLDGNVEDLRPRNHLYVTAGLTNLPLTFAFNTTTQADGFHELTAVAYEGSHVRTPKRISQSVRIQNTSLGATFTSLLGDTNIALEATLQFSVVANTNNITRIELFSTGGDLTNVTSQSAVVFAVAATNLGVGLHPFYALVTRADGKQYRTETKWMRVIGPEPPFVLSVVGAVPTLAWPATAGRRYEVMSTTNLASPFLLRHAVTPTTSTAAWSETDNSASPRFYRVQVSQ